MYKLKRYHTYVQAYYSVASGRTSATSPDKKIARKKTLKNVPAIRFTVVSRSSACDRSRCKVTLIPRQVTHDRSRSSILNHWRWSVSFISLHFACVRFINAGSIQRWTLQSMHDPDQFLVYEEWRSYNLNNELTCGHFWDFTMSFYRWSRRVKATERHAHFHFVAWTTLL